MKIAVKGTNYNLISDLNHNDLSALMRHIGNKDMSKYNVYIPYPLTEKAAVNWINESIKHVVVYGNFATAAIRDEKNNLIGEIGFDFEYRNVAEISYWLAKPYWSSGIMTEMVGRMVKIGFKKFKFKKIVAYVQAPNIGSAKVLQKNGFIEEAVLHNYVQDSIDVKIFAITKALLNG